VNSSAVLFDIDGTLVDSNYLHITTWARAFADAGADGAPNLRRLTGTRALLDAVAARSLQIVLATSAPEDELSILRKILEVEDIVSAVTSSEDVDTAKPRPDIVEVALRRSGTDAGHAVFVGDTEWDAKACRRANVPFIGLLCGGMSRDRLLAAGAAEVYDDPADLSKHLNESLIARIA
jgi:phosphoglycolate phosphatase-like HAD superfamily hydrolase